MMAQFDNLSDLLGMQLVNYRKSALVMTGETQQVLFILAEVTARQLLELSGGRAGPPAKTGTAFPGRDESLGARVLTRAEDHPDLAPGAARKGEKRQGIFPGSTMKIPPRREAVLPPKNHPIPSASRSSD